MVNIDLATGRPATVSDTWRRRIAAYQNNEK